MKIREPKPPGTLWATPGLLRDDFTFYAVCNDMCMYLVRIILVQEDYCGSNSPSTSIICVEAYYYYNGTEALSISLKY